MYEDYEKVIKLDKKSYQSSDVTKARKVADGIIASLGKSTTPETQQWRNYQARVFTMLEKYHDEAIRIGRFLFWYEGGDELFPTMFSAVRSRSGRKETSDESGKLGNEAENA